VHRVMNHFLEIDKNSMNNSSLRGGNLLLQYIQCTIRDNIILMLRLLGIHIGDKGYHYNERVQ
jgi:hypothetical protein